MFISGFGFGFPKTSNKWCQILLSELALYTILQSEEKAKDQSLEPSRNVLKYIINSRFIKYTGLTPPPKKQSFCSLFYDVLSIFRCLVLIWFYNSEFPQVSDHYCCQLLKLYHCQDRIPKCTSKSSTNTFCFVMVPYGLSMSSNSDDMSVNQGHKSFFGQRPVFSWCCSQFFKKDVYKYGETE